MLLPSAAKATEEGRCQRDILKRGKGKYEGVKKVLFSRETQKRILTCGDGLSSHGTIQHEGIPRRQE